MKPSGAVILAARAKQLQSLKENMEQILKSFATLEELDRFVGKVIPEDFIPLALERLVDLTANALAGNL